MTSRGSAIDVSINQRKTCKATFKKAKGKLRNITVYKTHILSYKTLSNYLSTFY